MMDKKYSLIHVEPFEEDHLDLGDLFTTKFDHVVKKDMYTSHKTTLAIYDFFRRIMSEKEKELQTPIITLSPDPSISSATLAGSSEKFMYSEKSTVNEDRTVFNTNLKVIYIDSSPDLSLKKYIEYSDYSNAVLSDVIGLNEESYSSHRVDIPCESVNLIGINEKYLSDEYTETIKHNNLNVFSLEMMRKKGIKKIMKNIVDKLQFENVHIVIDLSCLNISSAPSVLRNNNEGFDLEEIKLIIESLNELKYIYAIDITGYNFGSKHDKEKHHISNTITVKTIETIIMSFVKLQTQSINFFNENSKFLIWRPVAEADDDYGWYILRNMTLDERNAIINAIPDDEIITIALHDDESDDYYDALVTTTTIAEQQEKSYYVSSSVYDCCLFPDEKINMIVELLNLKSQE